MFCRYGGLSRVAQLLGDAPDLDRLGAQPARECHHVF